MSELLEMEMEIANESMENAMERLAAELTKIRTGKATPSMLSSIKVEYYGSPTLLNQVSNVTASDGKTLSIQPFEKSMIAVIEQAIFAANLGLTPQNNGESIMINIPALTEERRRALAKQARAFGEEAKISVRNARQKIINTIKKEVKDGYSEDAGKTQEANVQNMVNNYSERINKLVEVKEKDIMTV